MKQYIVLSPFRDADGIHKPGDEPVSLSDKDAAELIALGAIEAVAVAEQPADPAERPKRAR